ncbi:MAG: hypothetical protein AAB317_03605 [Nitrospirota bacterium]
MMVSRDTHLKVAAGLWGTVGFCLLMAGLIFLFGNRSVSTLPGSTNEIGMAERIGFVIALIIGFVKGQIVLPKVAAKNITRIHALPESSPLFMTFSVKSWMLVLGMILLGRLIRALGAPHFIVGAIYLAVGIALLLGSRVYLKGKMA